MCHTGGKEFQRRLAHSAALAIMAKNNFVPLLTISFANVLKFKAHLKVKCKCMCVTVCSLVMSPFSHDYMRIEID